ncbi:MULTISPECIES: VWA domain-containing protein [unclassified Oceanobacter]|jgi:Ca-activated chloride channel family protein|uniref:vWA domain-containing protein n=1 Tax=unclassified Oceanobacter TaxID=2620260 RepID=UPI002737117C|nr:MULTISPECIES: VWA domain-containing protein [unclassified Oceanobacter]MDP2547338.1 VWA domain-containing protein [Oceanobacter sp. 4_MG-2023]MDP2607464.1 VWA domain-containing protein [Oceanobacter sp. 1_MG-2023]MDP2610732.1 VWA domain-containing protein [Oceanobacter sp. 2_MG-2023]
MNWFSLDALASLEWYWPWAFVLLPLPLLIRFLLPAIKPEQAALRVSQLDDWTGQHSNDQQRHTSAWLVLASISLIWCLLVTALARPYQLGDAVALPTSGRDLLLAVDISGSMQREDMVINGQQVDRLSAVKNVVEQFIDQRQGDRLGLILFGSNAYIQTPLTFDRQTVRQYLLEAQIGLAGEQTAIGDAIGLGIKRLLSHPADSRVMVLLTDGANTAGEIEPLRAAALAADNQVRIYTIALGADSMVVPGLFGNRRVNPSRDLDEPTLTEIARQTGGTFFRARNIDELNQIYGLIDQLEPTEKDPEIFRPQRSLYDQPLGLALVLSLLLALARSVDFIALQQRLRHAGSRGK